MPNNIKQYVLCHKSRCNGAYFLSSVSSYTVDLAYTFVHFWITAFFFRVLNIETVIDFSRISNETDRLLRLSLQTKYGVLTLLYTIFYEELEFI